MARAVSLQRRWAWTIAAWAVALIIFFPILWTILTAFKTEGDAILFPPHSRRQPEFMGTCLRNRKEPVEGVQAILVNPSPRSPGEAVYLPEDTISLAAIAAWR